MTDLRQSLSKADFSHLKVVTEGWRLDLTAPDARGALTQLVDHLLGSEILTDLRNMLSPEDQEALLWLDAQGGKALWDHFSRRFGDIREMGAGKLEREQPFQDPISPAESLWYRALIARGFLETDSGPQEFVYLPEDLREPVISSLQVSHPSAKSPSFISRKATSREYALQVKASANILDDLCTFLAGSRMFIDPLVHLPGVTDLQVDFYQMLSQICGLLDQNQAVSPGEIRDFFDLSREDAMLKLWISWRKAENFPDISLLPMISLEGSPEIDPVHTRDKVITHLTSLDPESWWSIESFISQIKETDPDLLRKRGEYDSWFIKNRDSGEYLSGFSHWDEVEGALIRYLLTGPLHWLGLLDLGIPEENAEPLAFRFSSYSQSLITGASLSLSPRKTEGIQIRAKGEIRMTENVPHKTRYQAARFCDWFPVKADAYMYAITPGSLLRAEEQGLRIKHLLTLLKAYAGVIPPNILAALERWEKQGVQATISHKTILRLGSPAVLKALKRSKASRFILEQLGPTAVIVKPGSENKIGEALVELGFFLEVDDQTGSQT